MIDIFISGPVRRPRNVWRCPPRAAALLLAAELWPPPRAARANLNSDELLQCSGAWRPAADGWHSGYHKVTGAASRMGVWRGGRRATPRAPQNRPLVANGTEPSAVTWGGPRPSLTAASLPGAEGPRPSGRRSHRPLPESHAQSREPGVGVRDLLPLRPVLGAWPRRFRGRDSPCPVPPGVGAGRQARAPAGGRWAVWP